MCWRRVLWNDFATYAIRIAQSPNSTPTELKSFWQTRKWRSTPQTLHSAHSDRSFTGRDALELSVLSGCSLCDSQHHGWQHGTRETCEQRASMCPSDSGFVDECKLPSGVFTNLFIPIDFVESIIGDKRAQGVSLTGSERAGAACSFESL